MDEITDEQIAAKFGTLPAEIRAVITDPETYPKIEKVAYAHKLNRVEAGLLAQTTSMLLQGFVKPNLFVAAMIENLRIPQGDAVALAVDLNREIFSKIKESLEVVHGLRKPSPPQPVAPERSSIISPYAETGRSTSEEAPFKAKESPRSQPSTPPPAPKPAGSILEQKLGGAFRMKEESSTYAPPPPPLAPPKQIMPPPPAPTIATGKDPYRELP